MLQPTDRPPAVRAARFAVFIHPDTRAPAPRTRAAVRGFHQSWTAAGHHGKPQLAHTTADVARDGVVRVRFAEARGAEDRDARADHMQRAESAHEIAHRAKQEPQLLEAGMRPLE